MVRLCGVCWFSTLTCVPACSPQLFEGHSRKGAQRSLWLNDPIANLCVNYAELLFPILSSRCHLLYHLKETSYTLFFALLSILCAWFSVQVCCASSLGIVELRQKLWPLECRRNFEVSRISNRKFTPQSANTSHVVHCISIHSVPASCPQFFPRAQDVAVEEMWVGKSEARSLSPCCCLFL
jgi:hypothetical protein